MSEGHAERPKRDLRYEIKFLLDRSQYQAITAIVNERADQLQPDAYGDAQGQYGVTSLYYDTQDYKAYWDKVNGYRFRRKVRLRYYGDVEVLPETITYFEIKERMGSLMRKRRLNLSYAAALNLAKTATPTADLPAADQPTIEELTYLFSTLHLQPACIVSYQRTAYLGHADYPDLRITFDTDVRCRIQNLTLLSAETSGSQTLLAPGWAILEVKVNQTIPYWLAQHLSETGCTPRRISKYCASLERSNIIQRRQHIEMLTS